MSVAPRLVPVREPASPEGVVLVLHGGANRPGNPAVSPTQLSVLRMIPVARAVARVGGRRLAVYRLLNSHRGWDAEHTPVADAAWAMAQVAERYADLPVALVGHSLGGRAALLAGDQPPVRSVVALNPWVYPSDTVDLAGRQVLVVHGLDDRIAQPGHSETVARRLARTTSVGYLRITGAKHAMLKRGRLFDAAAADFVAATLLGDSAGVGPSSPVGRVLGGESWVTV